MVGGRGDSLDRDYSQSPPLYFREIIETLHVLPLMAAILIFKCSEGADIEDYSCSRGRGARKIGRLLITTLQLAFTKQVVPEMQIFDWSFDNRC